MRRARAGREEEVARVTPIVARVSPAASTTAHSSAEHGPTESAGFPSATRTRSGIAEPPTRFAAPLARVRDRKSTRLNSSHVEISYAVFCLKKKKNKKYTKNNKSNH